MRVDVLWAPCELAAVPLEGRTAVVVDVLRAATSILAALEAGARRVIPADSTEEALRIADSLGRSEVALCGEREGKRIDGYDFGNSPLEFTSETVRDRILVFDTTNGTRAIRAAAGAERLHLACYRNVEAAVERAAAPDDPVVVACAGRSGRVSLPDVLCAGFLVRRLDEGETVELGDGARAALEFAEKTGPPTAELLAATEWGGTLVGLGCEEDLEFCAQLDSSRAVSELREEGLVLAPSGG